MINRLNKCNTLIPVFMLLGQSVYCQSLEENEKNKNKTKQISDTVKVFEREVLTNPPKEGYPKFKFGGLFQTRYIDQTKNDVDIDGLHHVDGKRVSNSFDIKRMRVSMNAKLTENLEVSLLANLAEFKSDPKNKVLENAFARYTFNRYFQITVGQFRPLFGMEEAIPVDIVKSIDFSNQYYLFGNNGWVSFQVGAAITGNVDLGNVPFSYGFSVINGNGKNKTDDDNGKLYSTRLLFNLSKKYKLNLGFSGGIGEVEERKVHALALEATTVIPISKNWSLDLQSEAKKGINHRLFFSLPEDERTDNINDYNMQGIYILPNLRYYIGKKNFNAIEFSFRYEYLDVNYKLKSNPRHTYTPMISVEFVKNYDVRIQAGMQIDNFNNNIPNTTTYNSNLAFLQLQCRF